MGSLDEDDRGFALFFQANHGADGEDRSHVARA
jgi:hypothetical protein